MITYYEYKLTYRDDDDNLITDAGFVTGDNIKEALLHLLLDYGLDDHNCENVELSRAVWCEGQYTMSYQEVNELYEAMD